MNASELIQALQDYVKEHGDMVVVFDDEPDREVDSVSYYPPGPAEQALMLGG